MKATVVFTLLVFSLLACNRNTHQSPTHNFTIQRLIILNDKNEMLMGREENVWAPPSLLYKERQYLKEGLDSLANAFGVEISDIKLRGQFSFKYDYHPYATLRTYFVAQYEGGELKVPASAAEVKWLPIPEAIDISTVDAIQAITRQIIDYPAEIWGGSFMVSHIGDEHPTKQVEPFYRLN